VRAAERQAGRSGKEFGELSLLTAKIPRMTNLAAKVVGKGNDPWKKAKALRNTGCATTSTMKKHALCRRTALRRAHRRCRHAGCWALPCAGRRESRAGGERLVYFVDEPESPCLVLIVVEVWINGQWLSWTERKDWAPSEGPYQVSDSSGRHACRSCRCWRLSAVPGRSMSRSSRRSKWSVAQSSASA